MSTAVVETYQYSIADIYQSVGDETTSRWQALGDVDSKTHWAYGAEADALIPEFPAMQVYKAIALKAGKSSQVIRKAYYTYKAFTPETRKKYDACPYSVFQHARTQDNPEAVLEEYLRHPSVDYIERQYPEEHGDEAFEKEFTAQKLPRMFYSIYREIYGIDPFLKSRAMEIISELKDIIEQVNK